jgi:gluconolactonase
LADRYDGRRLNSPNDLVYRSDGALYFTDPPFGLPKVFDDPRKELPYSGVYCVKDNQVRLVSRDLDAPNGVALSPDEKTLYVNNWNEKRKVILRYDVNTDCSLTNGRLFFDMTGAPGDDALDGLKVDREGNVYSTGPGGIWVFSADGKQLGLIKGPEDPHNMTWGDDDGKALYITALTGLYRIKMNVAGVRP